MRLVDDSAARIAQDVVCKEQRKGGGRTFTKLPEKRESEDGKKAVWMCVYEGWGGRVCSFKCAHPPPPIAHDLASSEAKEADVVDILEGGRSGEGRARRQGDGRERDEGLAGVLHTSGQEKFADTQRVSQRRSKAEKSEGRSSALFLLGFFGLFVMMICAAGLLVVGGQVGDGKWRVLIGEGGEKLVLRHW